MPRFAETMQDDIEEILFTEEQIAARVRELGAEIAADYRGRDLVLVGILRGGMIFLSDLTRAIPMPHSFDMVGASSYGAATSSSGRVQITKDVEVNLRGKHVVVCEDIYDSGRTLAAIRDLLRVHHPASIAMASFLDKKVAHRTAALEVKYVGFQIPDRFVVGYGLDYAEYYRNLPYIGVLKPTVYTNAES